MQKVGYDANDTKFPKGRLDDPPTLKPHIQYFRERAAAYSRIDLEGVDSILRNHLSHRVALYTCVADILEREYEDIVSVMRSLQGDAEMRHIFTKLVMETDAEKSAAVFAELFAQLMADDEFESQVEQIDRNYQPVISEALDEAQHLDDEETAAAKALSEKYGMTLRPRYYERQLTL
jgi:hypothetical protein